MLLNCSHSLVNLMENGKIQPTTAKLLGISNIFKISLDELFVDFFECNVNYGNLMRRVFQYLRKGAIPCTKPIHSQKRTSHDTSGAAKLINIAQKNVLLEGARQT